MDALDFKISINKYYDRIHNILYCTLILILVLGSWKIIPIPPFVLFLAVIIFLFWAFFSYFKKMKQKFKILSIKENHLIIENNSPIEIDYMEIQNITLRYTTVKGSSWVGLGRFFITIPDTGQENFIQIITKEGKKIVRNIWCENDADYWRLKSLGSFFEERGIDIKMKGFRNEQ